MNRPGADVERAEQGVDDAVGVVQRQDVNDDVGRRPGPGAHQRPNLRVHVDVTQQDALRLPRRAARVQNYVAQNEMGTLRIIRRIHLPICVVSHSMQTIPSK